MPHRSKDGKVIIPAGEVGAYVVCPESWRLRYIENVAPHGSASAQAGVKAGADQHRSWVEKYDQTVSLDRYLRFTVLLLLFAVLLFLLVRL